MKIADFSLVMDSGHSRTEESSLKKSLASRATIPAPQHQPAADKVTLSALGQEKAASANATADAATGEEEQDIRLRLIIMMIEKMTGQKIKLFDARKLRLSEAPVAMSAPVPAQAGAGFALDYEESFHHAESEQTSLQAAGSVQLEGGKTLDFKLDLMMRRDYSETSSTAVHIGDGPQTTDPLVISAAGVTASLGTSRFAFDLNSDGRDEQINFPLSGSGFLAIDRNGDGVVNHGGELFGAATGDGFAELAAHDGDHNGWIDENDAVFGQLKVWTKDAEGNDQLQGLATLGVGAIALQSVATPFELKSSANQLLGAIRSSAVSLNENGSAGLVQQVDLTV